MAKSYESFDDKELKALYQFSCLYNQKLSSQSNDSEIRTNFPNLTNWEDAIGLQNLLHVENQEEVQKKLKNDKDNRFVFAKSGKTILGALLFHLNKAIMVGSLEKKNKSVIITHKLSTKNGELIYANGEIPLNNFKSFINLVIKNEK